MKALVVLLVVASLLVGGWKPKPVCPYSTKCPPPGRFL